MADGIPLPPVGAGAAVSRMTWFRCDVQGGVCLVTVGFDALSFELLQWWAQSKAVCGRLSGVLVLRAWILKVTFVGRKPLGSEDAEEKGISAYESPWTWTKDVI